MFHFFLLLNFYLFPNIFWKYTLLASLLMQTKEILWNHLAQNGFNQFWSCSLETDVRFRTNHQGNRLQTVSFASLSAHCHAPVVGTEVVHWREIPKSNKTKKHLMDEMYLEDDFTPEDNLNLPRRLYVLAKQATRQKPYILPIPSPKENSNQMKKK